MRKLITGAVVFAAASVGATNVALADDTHVVEEGDSLAGLAPERWELVAVDNEIWNPDLIVPGQEIGLTVEYDDEAAWYAAIKRARLAAWYDAVYVPPPPPREPEPTTPAAPQPQQQPATPEPQREASQPPVTKPQQNSSGSVSGAPPEAIAQCESGGNPSAVSANGKYRGKWQFDQQTWNSVGGSGDPAAASEAEQDRRAAILYQQRGTSPWPTCGAGH